MRKLLLGTVAALSFNFPVESYANLLVNGSFEDTTNFVGNSSDTMVLSVGSPAMPGWTVAGGEPLAWIGPKNPFGLSASNGNYFLDLTGYVTGGPPFSGVASQTFATSPGSTYLLSFDLGSSSNYGLPDAITATVAGVSQTFTSTATGTNDWQTETLSFAATAATTTISLIGEAGFEYIGLDNVSVVPIPEPASTALLGAGLLGLGVARRRKRFE
jgi:hypothetical protein